MKPLVSVIIPSYNASEFISGAIDSVLAQDYRPIEIIVVDDGSTDSTRDVILKYENTEVKYYNKENGGVSSARNYGIKKALGEYVRFVDADDFLLPGSICSQVKHATTLNNKEISLGHYMSWDGKVCQPPLHPMAAYSPWLAMYPKKALEEVNGFDTNMKTSEDLELTINLKAHGYRFVLAKDVVYQYRCGLNPDSLFMGAIKNPDWSRMRYFFEKHLKDYKNFTSFKEYYRFFIIDLFLYGKTSDYLYLRKKLPFFVQPTQMCKSRILGYVLWYGSYIIPFSGLRKFLNSVVLPRLQEWLHSHSL